MTAEFTAGDIGVTALANRVSVSAPAGLKLMMLAESFLACRF
jgi:hypothetical protein